MLGLDCEQAPAELQLLSCAGPVQDIEDALTITCPWHGYSIDLRTGSAAAPGCQHTASCEAQQAVYPVQEHAGLIW